MIQRDDFVKFITAVKTHIKKDNEFCSAMNGLTGESSFVGSTAPELIKAVVSYLEKEMGDSPKKEYGSMIEWWLSSASEKRTATLNGKFVDLSEAGKLFDFLKEVYGKGDKNNGMLMRNRI